MLSLFPSLFIAKITIFLGDSKLQTYLPANRLLLRNKPVIYSWKLYGIISCHFLLPPEVSRLHVALLEGAKVMIHWGNQMVSVDGPHPLQQWSVVHLSSYDTTESHSTLIVGEFMCVAVRRPVETNCAIVLTVAVALFILCLAQSIHLLNSFMIHDVHRIHGYTNSVFPPNSLTIYFIDSFHACHMSHPCHLHLCSLWHRCGTEYMKLCQSYLTLSFADRHTFLGICCVASSVCQFVLCGKRNMAKMNKKKKS
jgi:hypothetical protein